MSGEQGAKDGIKGSANRWSVALVFLLILSAAVYFAWKLGVNMGRNSGADANSAPTNVNTASMDSSTGPAKDFTRSPKSKNLGLPEPSESVLEIVYLDDPWIMAPPPNDFITARAMAPDLLTAKSMGGIMRGTVIFKGQPPNERVIPIDPEVRKIRRGQSDPTTQFYLTDTNGGLADVVVYLEGELPRIMSENEFGPLLIDHVGSFKMPYISATGVGQTIVFTNSDPLMHVIHVTPKPGTENREANYTLFPNDGTTVSVSFPEPELFIRLKCDVHPWEFAYVSTFDHYYFDVTGTDGSFSIQNVPPGDYKLHLNHRRLGTRSMDVSISRRKPTEVEIVYDERDARYTVNVAPTPSNSF